MKIFVDHKVYYYFLFFAALLFVAGAQEDLSYLSVSGSISSSASLAEESLDISDRSPCSFRGNFLLHKQSQRLDPCTECVCLNGTTTCNIESCPSELGCSPTEVVIIPSECCPQCPYRMFVADTNIEDMEPITFKEGDKKKIKFSLDIAVDKRKTSRLVRGENLWKLSGWVSANEDGSGEKYSLAENLFSETDAAKEYLKPAYPPWQWSKLKFNGIFTGGTCEEYNYFCVEFNQADEPRSTYDLDFTFQPVNNEVERLIDCVPLGECKGLTATDLDWEMDAPDQYFGTATPVTLNVEASFTADSVDRKGKSLWRVGVFASGNEDGSGPRVDEVYQTLDDGTSGQTKKGTPLELNAIDTNFEIGSVGCTPETSYVCVEFAKSDTPNPDFTLNFDSDLTSQLGNSLIKCKPQECYARAIFSTMVPELTGDFPAVENQANTIRFDFEAITDKVLSTNVPGSSLWELGVFFNTQPDGSGTRLREESNILDPYHEDIDLSDDANLEFDNLDFRGDLTGLLCSDVPFLCFELRKNDAASLDYLFGTNPLQDPFVECVDFSKYCQGVVYNGIVWDRRIPDHTPGDPVPLTIDAEIEVDPKSRSLMGNGLYEMSVFVASDPEGSDRKSPSFDQVLTPSQMSTNLPKGGPLRISNIKTPPLVVEQLGCGEFRYLCVEFRKGANSNPDYTAEFAQSDREIGSAEEGVVFKEDSLIQCREESCPDYIPHYKSTGRCNGPRVPWLNTKVTRRNVVCRIYRKPKEI